MSRFKSIRNKINKKSSISVDEKLAALDKELEKTGMSNVSEMMTTANIYSKSRFVPGQDAIISPVPDGNGLVDGTWTQSTRACAVAGHNFLIREFRGRFGSWGYVTDTPISSCSCV